MSENTPTPTGSLWRGSTKNSKSPDSAYSFVGHVEPYPLLGVPPGTEVALVTADYLDAVEVIRQRVSDGWCPARSDTEGYWLFHRSEFGPTEAMEPGVAAVLWPDPEPEETP